MYKIKILELFIPLWYLNEEYAAFYNFWWQIKLDRDTQIKIANKFCKNKTLEIMPPKGMSGFKN